MKKNNWITYFIFCALIFDMLSALQAATQPKFSIIPTTRTAMLVPTNFTKTVQYQVTNQTQITRTLTMVPIQGINQITSGTGACGNTFTLASHQSCMLTLEIHGNQIPPNIIGGPKVCKTEGQSNTSPDPFLCSQPNQSNILSIASAPPGQHAYITNWNGNSISLCQVNNDGSLESCSITANSGFDAPEAIAMNPSGTILYVANIATPSGGGTISLCHVDSISGGLSGCAPTGNGFDTSGPDGIAINPPGTIAYVSNAFSDKVSSCAIDHNTGVLSLCTNSGGTGFDHPSDMTLNAMGTLAYVSNLSLTTVSLCQIGIGGEALTSCQATGSGFNEAEGITLHPSGNFAYIASNGNNTISLCQVGITGDLLNCSVTEGTFDGFGNIGFNDSGTFAYVPRASINKVDVCAVDLATGALSSCVDSGGTGFDGPSGILLVR